MNFSEKLYLHLPIFLQNMLCTYYGYKQWQLRYSGVFEQSLEELKQSQWWSGDERAEYQRRRLTETIKLACRDIPFYRKRFAEHGVAPESIRCVEDLQQLPPLTKAEVFDAGDSMINPHLDRSSLVLGRTGGTTGSALPLAWTRECLQYQWAVCWRQRSRFGVNHLSRSVNITGRLAVPYNQTKPPFWRENRAFNQTVFCQHHMAPQFLSPCIDKLDSEPYEYYQGFPSALYLLACFLEETGRKLKHRPRAVFLGSESILDHQREAIERNIGMPCAFYGCSEFAGAASQCQEGHYHVDTEHCVIEIIPLEGVEQQPGQVTGKMLLTGFSNPAMPFIRYEVGDIATLLPDYECACGRKSPVLKRIDGRIESYLVTAEGRRVGRLGFLFKDTGWIREAQLFQDRAGAVTIKAVLRNEYTSSDVEALMRSCHSRLGDSMEITLEFVDSIPRSANGKMRAIISTVDKVGPHGG